MLSFDYNWPVKLLFGKGKLALVGKEALLLGTKALIVTGRNSTKKTGVLTRVINYLSSENISYEVFDKVEENPLTTTVLEGKEVAISTNCDIVIGLGGGSALDTAKAIAFCAKNDGELSDYIFGKKQGVGALPVIAITTTAGTGSEANSLAVLTNPETNDKKSLKSPYIYPKASIVDPELMTTLPKRLIASTSFDALTHAIEAYTSQRSNPITDIMALKAIELISQNMLKVIQDNTDIDAWSNVALGNTFGGSVIDTAGVALAHALEHPVSGLLNVRHGEGLAALFVNTMKYSFKSSPEKYANIAKAMGENIEGLTLEQAAYKSIDAVQRLISEAGLDVKLSDLGVKQEHIDWCSANCIKTMVYALSNNPKVPEHGDIKEIYNSCL